MHDTNKYREEVAQRALRLCTRRFSGNVSMMARRIGWTQSRLHRVMQQEIKAIESYAALVEVVKEELDIDLMKGASANDSSNDQLFTGSVEQASTVTTDANGETGSRTRYLIIEMGGMPVVRIPLGKAEIVGDIRTSADLPGGFSFIDEH